MSDHQSIDTAVILAAGSGRRLRPLTLDTPKCLTSVAGQPILKRLLASLKSQNITKLVVVVGCHSDQVTAFLDAYSDQFDITFVSNPDYRTTNNIYSLWLARPQLTRPFILLECDLVFPSNVLSEFTVADRMAISEPLAWMNGTMVSVANAGEVDSFYMYGPDALDHVLDSKVPLYKTVNIYSLSMDTWAKVQIRMAELISQGRLDEYYEVVFSELVAEKQISFDGVLLESDSWYEIDTIEDLQSATQLSCLKEDTSRSATYCSAV